MGLTYYRLDAQTFERLKPLIVQHEADILGPRARGYWIDQPEHYDYTAVRAVATQLDRAGHAAAAEALTLPEVEAQALSLLEIGLPNDGAPFPPTLFLCSQAPEGVRLHLKVARKVLGADAERAARHFAVNTRDPRFLSYLNKQLRHLRDALPRVWHFYERAEQAGQAVLLVDLRARDLFEPDAVELAGLAYD
ncbi:MAG: hypothetical protein CUN49_14585 [Candidatus Thermofonsia Clade 1 bacterium]|uniref:Uncharacterized protein n=1 Tax=Candidatus Thermofonsia Clade 1 bacterium TaxID=2364210 RepID=A0A2M8PAS4_9CHLR|nr:MAG: hypothetical protein CUN49_14585 [Candidatus Thermofonsia Clade 1 bacterium]